MQRLKSLEMTAGRDKLGNFTKTRACSPTNRSHWDAVRIPSCSPRSQARSAVTATSPRRRERPRQDEGERKGEGPEGKRKSQGGRWKEERVRYEGPEGLTTGGSSRMLPEADRGAREEEAFIGPKGTERKNLGCAEKEKRRKGERSEHRLS